MRKRQMYICRKCNCNCDPGELRGGICIDCIGKSQSQIAHGDRNLNLLTPLRARESRTNDEKNGLGDIVTRA